MAVAILLRLQGRTFSPPRAVMWLVRRKTSPSDIQNISSERPQGTPVRRKVKHSQSARECECYQEAGDRNVERNYILSFFGKALVNQEIERKPSKMKNKTQKVSENNEKNKRTKESIANKQEKKNALKRATSITLKRNRIIPLNDGTGGCLLVLQTTTIKETPTAETKRGSGNEKPSGKVESSRKRIGSILRRLSTVRRKAQKYLLRRNSEKERVEITQPPLPKPKPFLECEKIPSEDDFVEEHFQEDEPEDKQENIPSELSEVGRLSQCSSCYFTPAGGSPASVKRCHSPESVEEFEDEDGDVDAVDAPEDGCPSVTVRSIRTTLDAAVAQDRDQLRRRLRNGEVLYPNCDNSVWMRSCEKEVVEPIRGETTGMIPVWLKGTLLRNGPGSMRVGDMTFQHLFDSSALLHRFAIRNGDVTYQCRFLRTKTYTKNHAANRIVVNEFGTKAVPDPCQTIFKRVSALFNPGEELSDNAMISVYPFGDEFYCFTESPTIHRIDPATLETLERVNVSKHVAVVNHTSHPHVMTDGTVFNQAMSLRGAAPYYSIVKFPCPNEKSKDKRGKEMFDLAEVVASVRARWPLHPSYMHTFGLTDNFYVIVEQPLTISVPTMVKSQLLGQPTCSCFRFYPEKPTLIHVVKRDSGKVFRTYFAEAFFYLHIVNQFESENHLVIDICCYSDPSMLDCMYYDALKDMNKNPDYARLFRGRPLRFVLPLVPPVADNNTNLVMLTGSVATAWWRNGRITVKPELLCNLGCETPRINYSRYLGRPYRYFYAISSDVDLDNPGTLIKVDTYSRSTKTWSEPRVFPSEPVFVPSPDPQTEDDGVVLSALVWGRGLERQVGLLVLDAASWQELGRTVFHTPSSVPKCLHGWFTPEI